MNTLLCIGYAAVALAYPVSRPLGVRDDANSTAVAVLSTDAVDAFHGHALLAQAAYCENAAAALPDIKMLLIGGDGGTTPRCKPSLRFAPLVVGL